MKFRGEVLSDEDVTHFVKHFEDLRRSIYNITPNNNIETVSLQEISNNIERSENIFNNLVKKEVH